jgi:hypothetical protein
VKHGPKIGLFVCVLSACLTVAMVSAGCNAMRWGSESTETVYQETRPLALLNKYRYFKRVAANLDAQQADILAMQSTQKTWERHYGKLPVEKWPMRVQEQYDQRLTELNALKSNFNSLAADYNRAMADLSWSFCNVGKMPAGFPEDAQTPLKRQFATYIIN